MTELSKYREELAEALQAAWDDGFTEGYPSGRGQIHDEEPDEGERRADALLPVLARVVAEAKGEAWLEGHAAGRDYQGDGWNADFHDPEQDNPYRAEASGREGER